MSQATDIIRARRRAKTGNLQWLKGVVAGLLVFLSLLIGTIIMIVALAYADLSAGLPPIGEIEHIFGALGHESFQPVRIYDRTGEVVIFEPLHPQAVNRRWYRVNQSTADLLPSHVVQASVAALDETFWTNPGYDSEALLQNLSASIFLRPVEPMIPTISQRLVETHIVPFEKRERSPLAENLRSVLMAAELTRRYPKERILEWYLNSAYYGNLAYGIDAAALVYFGKHAADLSLAESAILASIPLNPAVNPFEAPAEVIILQEKVLVTMSRLDMIDAKLVAEARNETLVFQISNGGSASSVDDFGLFAWEQLNVVLGPYASHRGGLHVLTSIDNDLQLQTSCAAQTHLKRLAGGEVGMVEPAIDGSACVAAGLLPTLRPSDAGIDHHIDDVAVVVLDSTTGEILSMIGPALEPQPTGTLFMPYIYLTAFSQGYSPGTMVLDIPADRVDFESRRMSTQGFRGVEFHGPVRIRSALANSYHAASVWSLNLVGVDSVLRIARPMGLNTLRGDEIDLGMAMATGKVESTLLDMSFSFSVMANQGRMAGVSVPSEQQKLGFRSIDPIAILSVEDAAGRLVYASEVGDRAVLSQQLAFLMVDVLSDEPARWPAYGQSNALEVGRPVGVKTGMTVEEQDNWTLGFTPSRVVGVWVGNLDGQPMYGIHDLNGATPIWHAIIRYSTRDISGEGWVQPSGISNLEVCDPSGLLPTQYCPNVVREVFIHGTEPTHQDNLYQPFLINKETGKLATMSTPIDVVEERVYLVPPPEAVDWSKQEGIEQPPQEYDTLYQQPVVDPDVNITSPISFEVLNGEVAIRGNARPDGFAYYRLLYGQGLNPQRWIQDGEDVHSKVTDGILGRWNTEPLNGLYTLQLVVVQQDGQIKNATIYVTIDNQPPVVNLILPEQDQTISISDHREVVIEAEVSDNLTIAKVVFYIDGKAIETVTTRPYSIRWNADQIGDHTAHARAYDNAGHWMDSETITFSIVP